MKITLKQDQELFFTSDTHYNHANICKATTEWKGADHLVRDFNSLHEMNDTLVNNINSMVGEDDVLIHDGDWSFGGIENIWEFRKRIICKNIHLILGNHDHHIERDKVLPNCHQNADGVIIDGPWDDRYGDGRDDMFRVTAQQIFSSVNTYVEFDIRRPNRIDKKRIDKFYFVAMHYPISSWNHMNRGHIHVHGHVHLNPQQRITGGRAMDVGVDGNGFFPIKMEKVRKLVGDRDIDTLKLPVDHHKDRVL